jgi:hypothetical protein
MAVVGADTHRPTWSDRHRRARLGHVDHLRRIERDRLGKTVLTKEGPRERVLLDDPDERVQPDSVETLRIGTDRSTPFPSRSRSTAAVVRIFCPVSSNDAGLPT